MCFFIPENFFSPEELEDFDKAAEIITRGTKGCIEFKRRPPPNHHDPLGPGDLNETLWLRKMDTLGYAKGS